ncbi:MAG: hypothetical protein JNG84_05015 [Archangium sp.]|nr:hypothetical protein [Archangium sp.]
MARLQEHVRLLGSHPDPRWAVDVVVALAAAEGNPQAIAAVHQLLETGGARLRKRGLSAAAWLDVRQIVMQTLLTGPRPRITAYAGRGPLAAWLTVLVTRLGQRALRHQRPAEADLPEPDIGFDPEWAVLWRRYGPTFQQVLDSELQRLQPDERLLLKQFYWDGVSIDTLASMLGVHRSTAARRVARVRTSLREAIRQRLKVDLGTTTSDVSSLMRKLPQALHLSTTAMR